MADTTLFPAGTAVKLTARARPSIIAGTKSRGARAAPRGADRGFLRPPRHPRRPGGRAGAAAPAGFDRFRVRFRTQPPPLPILRPAVPVRLSAAVVLPLLVARTLGAQTAVVYGVVTDSGGAPLEHVRVQLTGTPLADLTDPDGRYRIATVSPGTVVLRATRVGLVRVLDTVTVTPGDSVRADFTMRASAVFQEPVIVTAAKRSQFLDQAATSVALVSDSDLARRAVSSVDEAVNKAPGRQFLSGQVNIRGSSGFVEG